MIKFPLSCLAFALGLATGVLASPTWAKSPREAFVAAAQPATTDGPSFRDPKTGQVWTPENVGKDGKPLSPDDRAFDPGGQAIVAGRPVIQYPRARHISTVPITAGPSVPIVEIDADFLRVKPGSGWRTLLYLQNNSGHILSARIACDFRNGDKNVAETSAIVVGVSAGERIAFFVQGPRSEVFVDSVVCRVLEP